MNSKQALETDVASVSSKTASQMADTDLVPFFRPNPTTGRDELFGKIPRSELTAAMLASLGPLLAGVNNGQTIDRVPTLNSGSFGSSTIADLASVLGVIQRNNYPINNALSEETGVHYVLSGASNLPTGVVSAFRLCVSAKNYPNHLDIFVYDYENGGLYYTHYVTDGGAAASWAKVATDIPSFYKNYGTLAALSTGINTTNKVNFTHTTDEQSFIAFVAATDFTYGLHIGSFHPNVYSMYMLFVQEPTKNQYGRIQWGCGWYILNGIMHSVSFENYDYHDHTCQTS
jgi:hypothetical protein